MKLQRFKVTNFRSIKDSTWIDCDDVTTLVGINESGKSNVLMALWKLNPVSGGIIDPLHDLPNSRLTELRNKLSDTCFITAIFELNDSYKTISDYLGIELTSDTELLVERYYDGKYHWEFCDQEIEDAVSALTQVQNDETETDEKPQYTYQDIWKVIKQEIPGFVYYSNYGNLTSRIYLPHAIKWMSGESIPGFDISEDQVRTLKVLFQFVNLKPTEIQKLGEDAIDIARRERNSTTPTSEEIDQADENKEKRGILLHSAGAQLTREFKNWWNQGEYKFDFETDGDYFRIWVSDAKRPDPVALELRSTGLQWFLSFFLIFLVECQGQNKNAILLLDEAGLTLHPLAQKDLSIYFNKLAETNPIIHTTHSPFIVDTDRIDRCRVVYVDDNGYTVVSNDLREGSGDLGKRSIYAVHAALGLSVSDVLFQGGQIVVVEGATDQYYLSAIKNVLIREKRIAPTKEILFTPAGGVSGVNGIISLVSAKGEDLPFVILDSDKSGEGFASKLKSGLYKDHNDRVINIKEISGIDGGEIEDLVPYSVIERKVQNLLHLDDDDEEGFIYTGNSPIVPQIEHFAEENGIDLLKGWKVELARTFNKRIFGKKQVAIPEEYLAMWTELFDRLLA